MIKIIQGTEIVEMSCLHDKPRLLLLKASDLLETRFYC